MAMAHGKIGIHDSLLPAYLQSGVIANFCIFLTRPFPLKVLELYLSSHIPRIFAYSTREDPYPIHSHKPSINLASKINAVFHDT